MTESEREQGWYKWLTNEIYDVEKILWSDLDPTHISYYKRYKSDMEKELKIIQDKNPEIFKNRKTL